MLRVALIVSAVLCMAWLAACDPREELTQHAAPVDACAESPSRRALDYHGNLARGEGTVVRYYSKRLLHVKLAGGEASAYIAGFEVIFGNSQAQILKEEPGAGTSRVIVAATGSLLTGSEYRLEMVKEDEGWYVDKVTREDGSIVKGFDAPPPPVVKVRAVR